jgi:hypothetical protein
MGSKYRCGRAAKLRALKVGEIVDGGQKQTGRRSRIYSGPILDGKLCLKRRRVLTSRPPGARSAHDRE